MNLVQLAEEYGVRNLRFFIPLSKLQYTGFLPGIGVLAAVIAAILAALLGAFR